MTGLFHLIAERARMIDRPFAAAMPLRSHHVLHLFVHSHRRLRSRANQIAYFFKIRFLLIDGLHQFAQPIQIKAAFSDDFQLVNQRVHLSDHEIEPMGLEQFLPTMAAEFPPARWQIRRGCVVNWNERRAERRRPRCKDALDAIARQPRRQQRRFRQSAPRRTVWVIRQRTSQSEAAIAAQPVVKALRIERVEVMRRKLFRRDYRRPPDC